VHAIAHSLGGLFDLPHGECNAMLLRHVAEYNYKSSCEKYDNILPAMGVEIKKSGSAEKKKKLFEKISELKLLSGIDATLKDKGISASDISIIAKNAIKDPCVATNPRKPDKRDIEVILEEAF
jgi:alcohol dehydrogenase class IV